MARVPFPVRERNRLGGPVDVKNPKWVHQNLKIYGEAVPKVATAFATDDPFTALGYAEDQTTRSIEKWSARPCQVDDSYLISYETYQQPALAFCDFLANALGLQVRCTYTMPGKVRDQRHYANWKGEMAIVSFATASRHLEVTWRSRKTLAFRPVLVGGDQCGIESGAFVQALSFH